MVTKLGTEIELFKEDNTYYAKFNPKIYADCSELPVMVSQVSAPTAKKLGEIISVLEQSIYERKMSYDYGTLEQSEIQDFLNRE